MTTKPRWIKGLKLAMPAAGYAYAFQIVVEKHQGKITCQSELNRSTEFVIDRFLILELVAFEILFVHYEACVF
ncbi:MAG: hypothetical protein HWQ43_06950 [Nostoc sp. JL31]|uniref:hypothetical protein n=1 Tax=Nostoc sp. JL31 TaxID=2815395 RepID=UPI0025F8ADCF|nr:hypothetical protein [Nostoc sp. JL31]MBN3888913.1 hypothetical protein [Nostoc sp. JL31]